MTRANYYSTIALMKKLALPTIVILLLQLLVGYSAFTTVVGDCGGVGLGGWACSGQESLWPIGLIAFIGLPIIGGKLFSDYIHRPLTWRRVVAIYFGLIGLAILVAILWSSVHPSRY